MTKSFDDIVSNYKDPSPEWQVSINGSDYTKNLELLEFSNSVNNPLKFTLKTAGLEGRNTDLRQGAEVVIKNSGFELFRGVLQQVDASTDRRATLKGSGYSAELDGDVSGSFQGVSFSSVVNSLVDTTSTNTVTSRTFSTSFNLGTDPTVDDFRVNKTQLKDTNRLMGEYSKEWYLSFDGSNNPVFNVTDQILNDDGSGGTIGTITTYGSDQSAETVDRNTNRNQGDYDGVIVRGYGDGDDQVKATAGSTGKGNRVLIYTDKTILSSSQAQKRADNLLSSRSVPWREIEVTPNDPNKLYGIGDYLTVDAEDAKLDGDYRVIETYYKIYIGEEEVESKITLSNKAQTFLSEFQTEKEKREGETDHMQGARNVWSDKETANATSVEPLTIDFEVPQDVVDIANNNRLDRIEFNYACTPFKQSADTSQVTADNFDPGTKVIDSEVKPSGVEMERSNIKVHNHPVGSATSRGAQQAQRFFTSSFTNQTVSGWTELGGEDFGVLNPENDLEHTFRVRITSITDTGGNPVSKDMHFAVLAESEDAVNLNPQFSWNPQNPVVGENVRFVDNTDFDISFIWHWRIEDSSTGTAVASGFSQEIDHVFEESGDYDVTLTVNGGGETNVLESNSSNSEFTASNDFTSDLQAGDAVRILRSDGNNGTYTIESFTTDGSGNTVVTVVEDIPFSYTTDESTGIIQWKIPPANSSIAKSTTETITISSPSTSTESLEPVIDDKDSAKAEYMKLKKKEKDNDDFSLDREREKSLRKKIVESDENISTEDVASVGYGFTTPAVEYMKYDSNPPATFWGYSLDIRENDSSSCADTDIEGFWQKDNNTAFFRRYYNEQNVDICTTQTIIGIGPADVVPDENDPFQGAGRYSASIRLNSSTLNNEVINGNIEWHEASRIVESVDATPNPDGDDQSEVGIDVDAWVGRGIDEIKFMVGEDDGSSLGTNITEEDNAFIDGNTFELREGESETFDLDGQSHTIEVVEIRDGFGPEAELIVDGNNEGDFDNGDVVLEEDFGDQQIRVRSVVNEYGIDDVDGNPTGTTYSGIVFETYLDNFNRDISGFDEGDYIAHVRFIGADGGEIKDPFLDTYETDNFTISLNTAPTADFSFTPLTPSVDDTVYFNDESSDPDSGDSITKWEWDFGDGTTETINSAPGDTSHKYGSSGSYTVTLTVYDENGASASTNKTVDVGGAFSSLTNPQTRVYESVNNVGATPAQQALESQLTSSLTNPNTRVYESVAEVGAQQSPGVGGEYCDINLDIARREVSDLYEVIAVAADGTELQVSGDVTLIRKNHVHDIPRQDDFSDRKASVGAGAENKEVNYVRSPDDRGDVLLDFSANNDAVTLDTTLNGNDAAITVGNIDDDGNITNTERIPSSGVVSNGTATSTNTYQDEELYVRIEEANDKQGFEVRDQGIDDRYTIAAAPEERFRSAKTDQETEGVSDDGGGEQDVITGVSDGLLAGSQANNVRIYIDDDPDNSGTNSETEITGDLYGGATDSGTAKDKELDISDYVDSPGWYRLKIEPDQPSFIKSRVFLDHHKDTQ